MQNHVDLVKLVAENMSWQLLWIARIRMNVYVYICRLMESIVASSLHLLLCTFPRTERFVVLFYERSALMLIEVTRVYLNFPERYAGVL